MRRRAQRLRAQTALWLVLHVEASPPKRPLRATRPEVNGDFLVAPRTLPTKMRKGKSGELPRKANR